MMTPRENAMAIFNREQPDYYGDIMAAVTLLPDPVLMGGGVPQDGSAGVVLRARVGPVKDEPGCGQECGEHAEQDGTCPQRSGPAERNRPPKPRAQDSGTWLHVPSPA